MSCPFEVSEDIASKVANLETRVAACEAALSGGRTYQKIAAAADGGLVATRVAELEISVLSETTNANANTPIKKQCSSAQKLSRYSLRNSIAGDNRDMSDYQQQLYEATLMESSLRENMSSMMNELAQHESCVVRVEAEVNTVGEAIERLTALLGVKERRITEFGASIGEATRAVEMLSKDVEKQLESVGALTQQMDKIRVADGQSARNPSTPSQKPIWEAIRSTQDIVMNLREAHAQGLQDVKDSVNQTIKQCVQHMKSQPKDNTDSLDSSNFSTEKQQLMQQLIDSQLRESENDKRMNLLEERLDGIRDAHTQGVHDVKGLLQSIEAERSSAPMQVPVVEEPRRLLSHVLAVQPHAASSLIQGSPPPRVSPTTGVTRRVPQRSASPPPGTRPMPRRTPGLSSEGPQRITSTIAGPRCQAEQVGPAATMSRRPSVRSIEDPSRSPSAQRSDTMQAPAQHSGNFPTMAEPRSTTPQPPLSAHRLSAAQPAPGAHAFGPPEAGLFRDRSLPKLSPGLPPRSPYITHRIMPGTAVSIG